MCGCVSNIVPSHYMPLPYKSLFYQDMHTHIRDDSKLDSILSTFFSGSFVYVLFAPLGKVYNNFDDF